MSFIKIQSKQLSVSLLPYGARICSVQYAGQELALGYSDPERYRTDPYYLGASIGPITNRIANGQLTISGENFQLPRNEAEHCLHSGGQGFDNRLWSVIEQSTTHCRMQLIYELADVGMRGELEVIADYRVDGRRLLIDYTVLASQDTYVNTTNHVYLNLGGDDISDHTFELYGQGFVVPDNENIPTGKIRTIVAPQQYSLDDFRMFDGGVDHHFHVKDNDAEMALMCQAKSHSTGIALTVRSNSPGYQFYTGRFLGSPFGPSGGFCIETQYAPDAINQTGFYAPLLLEGVARAQKTVFEFTHS